MAQGSTLITRAVVAVPSESQMPPANLRWNKPSVGNLGLVADSCLSNLRLLHLEFSSILPSSFKQRNFFFYSWFSPVCDVGCTELLVGIFWKLFELKKLLLSAWKMDRWLTCCVPFRPFVLRRPGGGCRRASVDDDELAGDVPDKFKFKFLKSKCNFLIFFKKISKFCLYKLSQIIFRTFKALKKVNWFKIVEAV